VQTLDYTKFIIKRALRIYPLYWVSMIISLVFGYTFVDSTWVSTISIFTWVDFFAQFTGFNPIINTVFPELLQKSVFIGGNINPPAWFIGTIIVLYLLYPIISRFLRYYGSIGFVLIIFISWVSNNIPGDSSYWSPIARLSEFALGVYIIQNNFYISTETKSTIIRFLSDLSFPVFLCHFPFIFILSGSSPFKIIIYIFVVISCSLFLLFLQSFKRSFIALRKVYK
jgi:peptidoglycan/LPS O-acetylase OafA/YrhL